MNDYLVKRKELESLLKKENELLNEIFLVKSKNEEFQYVLDAYYGYKDVKTTDYSLIEKDLWLFENPGTIGNIEIRKIAKILYKGFLRLINNFKKGKIKSLDFENNQIEKASFGEIKSLVRKSIKKEIIDLDIDFNIGIYKQEGKSVSAITITSGDKNTFGIKLLLPSDWNIQKIIEHKQEIYSVILHEATHVFDYLTKGYLLGISPNRVIDYLKNKEEWQAFILNISLEMKEVYKKNPSRSFQDALESSKTWNLYNQNLFLKNDDNKRNFARLRNRILSKLAFWWMNELKN